MPDRFGPVAVLVLAAVGTGLWAFTAGNFGRDTAFDYFAGWVAVAMTAAGIYGFSRSLPSSLTAKSSPPEGAAQERTGKM